MPVLCRFCSHALAAHTGDATPRDAVRLLLEMHDITAWQTQIAGADIVLTLHLTPAGQS